MLDCSTGRVQPLLLDKLEHRVEMAARCADRVGPSLVSLPNISFIHIYSERVNYRGLDASLQLSLLLVGRPMLGSVKEAIGEETGCP